MTRPQSTEAAEYYSRYIDLITSEEIVPTFKDQLGQTVQFLEGISEEQSLKAYEPGKWSIREVIGHLADAERIHTFRALTFARNDAIELPKWGPDSYAAAANFNVRSVRNLVDEELAVRDATIALFSSLPAEAWSREGTVSGKRLTVRAIAYIATGHVKRHLNILRERYGVE